MTRTGGMIQRERWWRWARLSVIVTLGGLLLVARAPTTLAKVPWQLARDGTIADGEPTADGERADAMATTVAVLYWQGEQGAESVARVSDVAVPNLTLAPARSMDARAEQMAAANAAATATAVAYAVQATVAAQATSAAREAAALAATQEANAQAEATAAARATQTAQAMAMNVARANATVVAASVAATMAADARASAVVAAPAERAPWNPSWLLALVSLLGGLAGITFWRSRREPFVLKANPARA